MGEVVMGVVYFFDGLIVDYFCAECIQLFNDDRLIKGDATLL